MGNAELVHVSLGAWNEGGLRPLSDNWWTDDIVWHDLPNLPDPIVTRGRGHVEARVEEMIATIGQFRFVVKDVEEIGDDATVAELELVGEGAQSGAAFMGTVHQLCRWRDGRVCEVQTFGEREPARAAAKSAR